MNDQAHDLTRGVCPGFVYQTSRDSDTIGPWPRRDTSKRIFHNYFFVQQIKETDLFGVVDQCVRHSVQLTNITGNNQRLGSASEGDAFLASLGAYKEKGPEKGLCFAGLNDTPHAPPPFLLYFDTNNSMILLNL